MNKISKSRIELAKRSLERFRNENLVAALVTGSVAKGIADENSDIDTVLIYDRRLTNEEMEEIIAGAKATGGDFYHGTPELGFAVYYYFEGVRCDFGFGHREDTERLFDEVINDTEAEPDLMKHLQVNGILDSVVLYGEEWVNKLRKQAAGFPESLQIKLVRHHLRFHPKWAIEKMAIERNDVLFYYETLLECTGNMIGILCGLNKIYHPGKIKGAEYTVAKMKIKPRNFRERCTGLFKQKSTDAVSELYKMIEETCDLIDKHLPAVSTVRSREVQKMILRKD